MINTKRYLDTLFYEFERMGYNENQITQALYDFYDKVKKKI